MDVDKLAQFEVYVEECEGVHVDFKKEGDQYELQANSKEEIVAVAKFCIMNDLEFFIEEGSYDLLCIKEDVFDA